MQAFLRSQEPGLLGRQRLSIESTPLLEISAFPHDLLSESQLQQSGEAALLPAASPTPTAILSLEQVSLSPLSHNVLIHTHALLPPRLPAQLDPGPPPPPRLVQLLRTYPAPTPPSSRPTDSAPRLVQACKFLLHQGTTLLICCHARRRVLYFHHIHIAT